MIDSNEILSGRCTHLKCDGIPCISEYREVIGDIARRISTVSYRCFPLIDVYAVRKFHYRSNSRESMFSILGAFRYRPLERVPALLCSSVNRRADLVCLSPFPLSALQSPSGMSFHGFAPELMEPHGG